MSQTNRITRNARFELSEETLAAFATEPSGSFPFVTTPLLILPDSLVIDGLLYEALENNDESIDRLGARDRILGLKRDSKFSFNVGLKGVPTAAQLITSVASADLSHRILYRHMFGSEHVAAGSVVITGSTTTAVEVTSTHGARFAVGTWIAVEVAGQMEPTRVESIAGDVLTVLPALSASPTTGGIVRNGYNYCPANSHEKSLAFRRAYSSSEQFSMLGCAADMQFKFPAFGKLLTLEAKGMCTDWSVGSLGYSTAVVTEDMGGKAAFQQATMLFGARSSLDRSTSKVPYHAIDIKMASKWESVDDGNQSQARGGWVNTAGPRPVSGMLKTRLDIAEYAAFASRQERNLVQWVRIGSGTTASFLLWDLPRITRGEALSKPVKLGERMGIDTTFEALQDSDGGGVGTDAAKAPLRFAMI